MKTLLPIGLMAFLAHALPAPAAASISDQTRFFATCAGRLSAQMEHEWLLSDPASQATEAMREAMLELLSASMGHDQGRQVLTWRIEAKMAHASLLTRATFNDDQWANRRASDMVRACTSIIMS